MQQTQTNDVREMTGRAQRLIDAMAGAMMSAAEAAAEKVELAAQVARVEIQMQAVGSVLEVIGAQKDQLLTKALEAKGALRAAYLRQVDVLTAQEVGILQKIGVAPALAEEAVKAADEPKLLESHPVRARRAAKPATSTNGVSVAD